MCILRLIDVCKSFHNVKVLDTINIEVQRGSIIGIVGPSGGGKSTLLRCIQGLEAIDSGKIEKYGRTGFMFQDFQLFPHMTVLKNLTFAPLIRSLASVSNSGIIDKREAESHIENEAMQILQKLGLGHKAAAYPAALSGGQKQRVALARSMMMKPCILLCDEPTSGLDQATGEEVASLLNKVNNDSGITVIIASHDRDFLKLISNTIIPIGAGRTCFPSSSSQAR
ncbi:MAG: ATP-binding cassette domain-containing protein [Holosporales bacterium]|jgi:polar amino acid transport system ATP-binding protein|nr:ATP-binding cassette domain-containing protein [Holosporales bacterium]